MLQDGYSQRCIASPLHVSRNTVAKVVKATSDHQLSKDALEFMEEVECHHTLFPEDALLPTLVTPDFPYIDKELLKSGVTLKLLWQPSTVSYIRTMSHRINLPCISNTNLVTNLWLTGPGPRCRFTIKPQGTAARVICLWQRCPSVCIAMRRPAVP